MIKACVAAFSAVIPENFVGHRRSIRPPANLLVREALDFLTAAQGQVGGWKIGRHAIVIGVAVIISTVETYAQGTLIAVPKRRDIVFDNAGKYLYFSASDGVVGRYNLANGTIDKSYTLGGALNGLDIDQNDSVLLVAHDSQPVVHRINLTSGSVTSIGFTPVNTIIEKGPWDVAIAANGVALFTTVGYAQQPLRLIDLSTNAISTITGDFGGGCPVSRSADGSRVHVPLIDNSDGTFLSYNGTSGDFELAGTGRQNVDFVPALSADGTLLVTPFHPFAATPYGLLTTLPGYHFQRPFHGIDGGVVFDATKSLLYGVDTAADKIIAYDLNTGAELYRLNIGENLGTIPLLSGQFGSGQLASSRDGQHLAVTTPAGIRVFTLPQTIPSPSPTPTPAVAALRDMVFDHADHLFVTTSDGFVWRYDVGTQSFDTYYFLSGSLNGLDITADDQWLVVAQNDAGLTEGIFYRLNIGTGEVSNISLPSDRRGEKGGWDVAIAANGHAFMSRRSDLVGPCQLRDIDLATNVITDRSPMGAFYLINQDEPIRRSADRTRLYFIGTDDGGRVFSYDTTTDSFGPITSLNTFLQGSVAVNRDGTLVATRIGNTAAVALAFDQTPVHSFNGISAGVVFDSVRDRFYGVNAAADVISGFNTATFVEEVRIPIGEDVPGGGGRFGASNMAVSPDGHYLALLTTRALRVYDLTTAPPPPSPTPTPTPIPIPTATPIVGLAAAPVSVNKGGMATFTVSLAAGASQDTTVNYSMSGNAVQGADYILSGTPNHVTILAGQSSATVNLTVTTTKTKKKEKATMTLTSGSGYQFPAIGKKHRPKPPAATVTIINR